MRKRILKQQFKKTAAFLAAAALSASLLGTTGFAALASETSGRIETSVLIPDNITIQSPASLSEIRLPDSPYGTLKWADDSQYADERSESFEVVFIPGKDVDLSGASGWDSSSGKLRGYVTVVITDLEEIQEESYEESYEEPQEEISEDVSETALEETGETPSDAGEEEFPEDASPVEDEESSIETEGTSEQATEDTQQTQTDSVETASEEENSEADSSDADAANTDPSSDTVDTTVSETGTPEEEDSAEETPAASDITETPVPESIFDQELSEEDRPEDAAENLTEEEMAVQGEINHSSGGICVTGVELPWYVQFRVSDGSEYQFSNESNAAIFKSYEFELWDLKNDEAYEIPDGQYISVMIPVTAGYNYTVEHILDNGAIETIVPTLNESTLIFSTHSFSPFGIAGSTPVVGGDIAENNYVTPTPTPGQTTATATATPTPSTSSTGNSGSGNNSGSSSTSTGNSGSSSGSSSSTVQNQKVTPTPETSSTRTVQTGDNTPIVLFVVLAILACAVIAGILIWLLNRK